MLGGMAQPFPISVCGNSAPARMRALFLALAGLSGLPAMGQYGGPLEGFRFQNNARASVTYDSNIAGNRSEASDTILRGDVTFAVDRRLPYARLGVELTGVAAQYLDQDQFSYQDAYLNWIIDAGEEMGGRRLRYSVDFSLRRDTRTTEEVQGQVTEQLISAGGEISYRVSRLLSVGGSIRYSDRDPKGEVRRFSEDLTLIRANDTFGSSTMTYSLFGSWVQSENLQYRLTASRRTIDSDRVTQEGDVDSLTLSVIGQISPKLSGSLSAGVESRSFDLDTEATERDQTSPTFSASLSYRIDELSTLSLSGSRRFGTSINGSNSESTQVRLAYTRRLSRLLSFNASVSLSRVEYEFSSDFPVFDPEDPDAVEFIVVKRVTQSDSTQVSAGLTRQLTEDSVLDFDLNWTDYDSEFRLGQSSRLRATLAYSLSF
jgi:hypothetical protein